MIGKVLSGQTSCNVNKITGGKLLKEAGPFVGGAETPFTAVGLTFSFRLYFVFLICDGTRACMYRSLSMELLPKSSKYFLFIFFVVFLEHCVTDWYCSSTALFKM